MALPDSALSQTNLPLAWFAFFDVAGDPLRATTLYGGRSFAAGETGDADLDGQTFFYIPPSVVSIDVVVHGRSGSDAVSASLSGIPGVDDTLLNALATATNWQGRPVRLWHALNLSTGLLISPYFRGHMTAAPIQGDPDNGQMVAMQLETYQSLYASARNRTWQDQTLYDAGDLSPARIRAAANGASGAAIVPTVGGGGGGGGPYVNLS